MKKILISCVAVALLLTACSSTAQRKNSSANQSNEVVIKVATDTDKAAKQSVSDYLAQNYSEDDIISVNLQNNIVEAKIRVQNILDEGAPNGWADTIEAAEVVGGGLLDTLPEDALRNASALYLIDPGDNILLTVVNGKTSYNAFKEGGYKNAQDNPETISLAEFNAIKTGMTYQEVFTIVGSRGTAESAIDLGLGDKYYTVTHSWKGEGSLVSGASVTFQGGKVTAKMQVGLE